MSEEKTGWTVYQGPLSSYTVIGTPIFIDNQMVAIVVEQDWESILETAVQAEVDRFIATGQAYTEARARGEI